MWDTQFLASQRFSGRSNCEIAKMHFPAPPFGAWPWIDSRQWNPAHLWANLWGYGPRSRPQLYTQRLTITIHYLTDLAFNSYIITYKILSSFYRYRKEYKKWSKTSAAVKWLKANTFFIIVFVCLLPSKRTKTNFLRNFRLMIKIHLANKLAKWKTL